MVGAGGRETREHKVVVHGWAARRYVATARAAMAATASAARMTA